MYFPLNRFASRLLSFVMDLFSSGQGNLYLDVSIFKVDRKGNDRESSSYSLDHKLVDLSTMKEQLSGTQRLMTRETS